MSRVIKELVGDALSARVRAFYERNGESKINTARRLRLGDATFEEALTGGLMLASTRKRLIETLVREEERLAARAS